MNAEATQVITAADVQAAERDRRSLITKMANKYGLEPNKMMATLKATAFKGDVSNEQMAALLIVADKHNLNPWLKEIYAFPSRQGIVPIVGVDGWARIINEHPEFDGMDFKLEGEAGKEAYTCTIYRKDRKHPVTVTEYMTECYRKTDPWQSHPLRMLRHKAMIQCARLAFSFAGIYDPDEGERVLAAEEAIDVTPGQEVIPAGKKVGPKKLREVIDGMLATLPQINEKGEVVKPGDGPTLLKIWNSLDSDQALFVWNELRSWERSAIKKLREEAMKADSGIQLDAWAVETLRACATEADLMAAYKTIVEAYEVNGVTEVPEPVQLVCDEMRMGMGAA